MEKRDWWVGGLKQLGEQLEQRLDNAVTSAREQQRDADEKAAGTQPNRRAAGPNNEPPFSSGDASAAPRRNYDMDYIEPDWDDLDHKADMIVARYAIVSGAWNVLPPPLDMMGVTATFAKMATELSGVYQVVVSSKRARQLGWAIATTTASVLGVAYAGARLMKLFPGVGWLASLLVQAPIVAAVAWAAGDTLKSYFKQTRKGVEPSLKSLQESFARTLRIKLKTAKPDEVKADTAKNGFAAAAPVAPPPAAVHEEGNGAVDKIAGLHELLRGGAITQAEYDAKKTELLKSM